MTASRIRLIVVLLIATLMFVGVVYAIDVPVENPSFTYSLSGWSVQRDSCTIEWTADGISIPGAALFTCDEDEGNSGLLVQTVNISSSGVYTFSIESIGNAPGFIVIAYSDVGGEDEENIQAVEGPALPVIQSSRRDKRQDDEQCQDRHGF